MTIAASNHSIAQHRFECIQACLDCARMCNTCGDDMIGMSHEGGEADVMTRCIRLCRDCSDICLLAAQWMGRTSAFAVQLCACAPKFVRSVRESVSNMRRIMPCVENARQPAAVAL